MRTWILVTVMMIGLSAVAQPGNEKRGDKLTPEQRVELQTKKMTLELDLNDKQQQEVKQLLTKKSNEREERMAKHKAKKEEGKKLTPDERFAMQSNRLDKQIEIKREMKKILTPEQFEKFEAMHVKRHEKITKRSKNLKKHHRE
jgi:Spy/CpxP family protein refolding chaperone